MVSKNGNFILNVCPRKDGTFDDTTLSIMLSVGNWMSINGEAIYDTTPFTVFGEGPTIQIEGGIVRYQDLLPFTAEDVRFTQKDGVLYAILLGWSESGTMTIKSLGIGGALTEAISLITMLGDGSPLQFSQSSTELSVTLPETHPCEDAYVLKIEF